MARVHREDRHYPGRLSGITAFFFVMVRTAIALTLLRSKEVDSRGADLSLLFCGFINKDRVPLKASLKNQILLKA
jgi:hypothetical protein